MNRIGLDIVQLAPLKGRIARSRNDYVARFWTEGEREYCNGSVARLASRWAAKEACMKVLRRGIGQIDPLDIEVYKVGDVPFLRLHDAAVDAASDEGLSEFAVSLTREREWAAAVVIAKESQPDGN
ncbi:holo-ACP synthase [Microbacterium sp. NPDC055502]